MERAGSFREPTLGPPLHWFLEQECLSTSVATADNAGDVRSWSRRPMPPIYLDYNATTPLDPAVIDALLPCLREHFGNPSSGHFYGKTAHDLLDLARQQVAGLLGAQSDEIVFTGGGSEASNHAIKGTVFAKVSSLFGRWFRRDAHLITSAVEHPATL